MSTPALIEFSDDKIGLIKRTMAKGATDDELKLFLHQCQRTGLDPLAKQIYFQKRFNKKTNEWTITIITGIDGYRALAARTGQYAGNDDPVFDNDKEPSKATVTVYRIVAGMRCPFTATARWDQYYPGDQLGFMWRKMPHLMLGKCAEALALRKAFPAELSGIYTHEEMEQAGPAEVYDAEPKPVERIETSKAIYTGTEQEVEKLIDFIDSCGVEDPIAVMDEIDKRFRGKPKSQIMDFLNEIKRKQA